MRTTIRSAVAMLGVLGMGLSAHAGSWTSQSLGQTPPLWYEFRASVNDTGAIAATRVTSAAMEAIASLSGSSVTVLPKRALSLDGASVAAVHTAAMDITSDDRFVGFRATANMAQRQASWWVRAGSSYTHRDLHPAAQVASPNATLSAAYGISGPDTNEYYVAGYVREKVSPQTLSKPLLWTVTETSITAQVLPLPGVSPAQEYGIAYGVSDKDRAATRHACGGTGVAESFMTARCWDVSDPTTPVLLTTHANLTSAAGVATSVVNRVRTIDFGGASTGAWQGKQNIAVGHMTFTSGGSAGFVWNLTTGTFDIETAIQDNYDSLLLDVTKQSFSQAPGAVNSDTGKIVHGPMVVGSGSTSTARLASTTGANILPGAVRGISQTRIAGLASAAASTDTCNMAVQTSGSLTVDAISGVSRNAFHMVGSAGGQLVRLSNTVMGADIKLFHRSARVYSSPTAYETVAYHWATVEGHPSAKIMWSASAGCDVFSTGLACASSLDSDGVSDAAARISGNPSASYAYVQAANLSGQACRMSPVYAVSDLGFTVNPSHDTSGAVEQWADCSSSRSNDAVWTSRIGGGHNINLKKDFFHCGACNRSANDGLSCTSDSCANGDVVNTINSGSCLISGACRTNGETNPSNQCQSCQSATNNRGWTNKSNGAACSTDVCREGETCSNGVCAGGDWKRDSLDTPSLNDTAATARNLGTIFDEDHYWSGRSTNNSLTLFPSGDEDWYTFQVDDCWQNALFKWNCGGTSNGSYDNGNVNENPQPRVALTSPAGMDYDLCVYVSCIANNSPVIDAYYGTTNGASAASVGHAHPNGYPGICSRGGVGVVDNVEIHPNCDWIVNDSVKVWVKVFRYSGDATCTTPYTLEWGNDKD